MTGGVESSKSIAAEAHAADFMANIAVEGWVRIRRHFLATEKDDEQMQVFTGQVWRLPTAESPYTHIGSVILESSNGAICHQAFPNLVLNPSNETMELQFEPLAKPAHLKAVR